VDRLESVRLQITRAKSVKHRCRKVCVEKCGRSACSASCRTTFDQVHKVMGCAKFLADSERNNGPRLVAMVRRCARYDRNSSPVVAE